MTRDDRPRKLTELAARLDRGWSVIDAEPDRANREKQVDFWLSLLAAYQRLADWIDRNP
jgi:hypothetical protein